MFSLIGAAAPLLRRYLVLCVAFPALLVPLTACSSGGSGGNVLGGRIAEFSGSGTPSAADLVRLTGTASGDTVTVSVVISGPTTSSDLYSFAFDLVLGDPAVAIYESGSANAGTALTLSGGQTLQVLAVQNGGRVTVGMTKLGGGPGNGIAGTQSVIVSLRFRLLLDGNTTLAIEGSPPRDPAAIDSGGAEIPSVVFDAAPAMLSAS